MELNSKYICYKVVKKKYSANNTWAFPSKIRKILRIVFFFTLSSVPSLRTYGRYKL